ncbi:hypothetical protein FHR70_004378 [Microvirga lupini]|uniref:Uncharacterized protein n=1 Tax=Microvirga lupini TaxID=420324 RepID=A0A7W4VQ89_9HYPH|nr:hypothetical protein [Microvirga lupini]
MVSSSQRPSDPVSHEHCRSSDHTVTKIKVRLSRSEAFDQSLSSSIYPVAKDRRRRTGLKSSYRSSESSTTNADHETAAKKLKPTSASLNCPR